LSLENFLAANLQLHCPASPANPFSANPKLPSSPTSPSTAQSRRHLMLFSASSSIAQPAKVHLQDQTRPPRCNADQGATPISNLLEIPTHGPHTPAGDSTKGQSSRTKAHCRNLQTRTQMELSKQAQHDRQSSSHSTSDLSPLTPSTVLSEI
jgi:hypothetical protein